MKSNPMECLYCQNNDTLHNLMIEIERAIDNLEYNLHSVSIDKLLDRMGFPKNYMDIKNINKEVE